MRFSKTTEYALRTMIFLACQNDKCNTTRICEACDIPSKYFQKISHLLASQDMLLITRGKLGGFSLARRPEEITAAEIIAAAQPAESEYDNCRLFGGLCANDQECNACALRQSILKVEAIEEQVFGSLTLDVLAYGDKKCCTWEEVSTVRSQTV